MLRKTACGALMILSVVVAALAYSTARHHDGPPVVLTTGDLVFYPTFALAVATFTTAWIVGWMLDGVLGDKRRSLAIIFVTFFGAFLLRRLGPVAAASALGKDKDKDKDKEWVNGWRTYPMMVVLLWQTIKAVRDSRAKALR